HGRESPGEQTGFGLTAQHRNVHETAGARGDERLELRAVGELTRAASTVRQDNALSTLEGLSGAQHREKRAEARAGCEQPELSMRRNEVEGEEALRLRIERDARALAQLEQRRRQQPLAHPCQQYLEQLT